MDDTNPGNILPVSFADALSERYLAYALSTIMSRSLPDVRDGLKPVQRRLLYAMRGMRLGSSGAPKKAAKVVGEVMGNYHPHGDGAIYDTMVRLAQEFAQRYPLVDGQGNFGNIDGDNPAAMRYTEARLTAVAELLLQDLENATVDFRDSYDGENEEPEVLPAAFPNLLANGAMGIAVGMACAVPPHNAGELIEALKALIKQPKLSARDLMAHVSGPDFPTGGVLVEPQESMAQAYETGRGAFRLRARWHREDLKGGAYHIIVTEIPYQVQKSRLVERLVGLVEERGLPLLGDVRDESDEAVRILIEPKSRKVDADLLMEALFKQSELETRVSLNLNVLDANRTPRVMNLAEALSAFVAHRFEVLERRLNTRLGKIDARVELLEGYLLVFLNLDEVIRIIREEDEPKAELMRSFTLSDTQAEAVLNMRLRALRKLEEMVIREELDSLLKERSEIEDLLGSDVRKRKALTQELDLVKADLAKMQDRIGQPLLPRRTQVSEAPEARDFNWDQLVEKEPLTVVLSAKGWIRALKGHGVQGDDIRYRDGDGPGFLVQAHTTDHVLMLTRSGRAFTLRGDSLPGGRGLGEPLSLLLDLPPADTVVALWVPRPEGRVVLAASSGHGFCIEESMLVAETRKGKQILNLAEGSYLAAFALLVPEHDSLAVIGDNHKLLVFPLEEVPLMTRGKGVKLQGYRDGGLSDMQAFAADQGLSWRWGKDKTRTEKDLLAWQGKRAGMGRLAPSGFPKSNRFW